MRAREFTNEISDETLSATRAERYKQLDKAYKELRGWKRFVPPLKNRIQRDIEKANRGIRRADDTEYRNAMQGDREFIDDDINEVFKYGGKEFDSERDFFSKKIDFENHRKTVARIMNKHGYRKLGAGVDAMVFGKKGEGNVVKIIIPEDTIIEQSENTFAEFMKFCKQNKRNPHLPKFVNLRMDPIVIDGEKFSLQGMERLKRLSADEEKIVFVMWKFLDDKKRNTTFERFITTYYKERIKDHGPTAHPGLIKDELRINKKAAKEERFFNTLKEVMLKGKQLGFTIDIFPGEYGTNVMKRDDGTLVIMDPWVK